MGEVGFGYDAGEAGCYGEWGEVGGCLAVLRGGSGYCYGDGWFGGDFIEEYINELELGANA